MERAVRQQLIPYCYRSMALKPTANAKAQLEAFKQVRTIYFHSDLVDRNTYNWSWMCQYAH